MNANKPRVFSYGLTIFAIGLIPVLIACVVTFAVMQLSDQLMFLKDIIRNRQWPDSVFVWVYCAVPVLTIVLSVVILMICITRFHWKERLKRYFNISF
jgi:hypothetical protein